MHQSNTDSVSRGFDAWVAEMQDVENEFSHSSIVAAALRARRR